MKKWVNTSIWGKAELVSSYFNPFDYLKRSKILLLKACANKNVLIVVDMVVVSQTTKCPRNILYPYGIGRLGSLFGLELYVNLL